MFPSSATLWGEGSVWGRFKPQPGEPWLREQAGELKQQFGLPLRTSEIWQTKKSKKKCQYTLMLSKYGSHRDTCLFWILLSRGSPPPLMKNMYFVLDDDKPLQKNGETHENQPLKKRWSRTWKYRISWTCLLVPIPIFHSWRNSSRRFLHANARRGTKYFEARAALRPSQWYQLLPRFFATKKRGPNPSL